MPFTFQAFNWEMPDAEAIALRDQLNTQYPPEKDVELWYVKSGGFGVWWIKRGVELGACGYSEHIAKRIAEMLNSREELA